MLSPHLDGSHPEDTFSSLLFLIFTSFHRPTERLFTQKYKHSLKNACWNVFCVREKNTQAYAARNKETRELQRSEKMSEIPVWPRAAQGTAGELVGWQQPWGWWPGTPLGLQSWAEGESHSSTGNEENWHHHKSKQSTGWPGGFTAKAGERWERHPNLGEFLFPFNIQTNQVNSELSVWVQPL